MSGFKFQTNPSSCQLGNRAKKRGYAQVMPNFQGSLFLGLRFRRGGGGVGVTVFATTDLTAFETILNSLIIFPLHS